MIVPVLCFGREKNNEGKANCLKLIAHFGRYSPLLYVVFVYPKHAPLAYVSGNN
jgi:hypothetical protein